MKKTLLIGACLSSVLSFAQKAPTNWFNADYATDKVRGISTEKALELLKDRKSQTVIVGVIDSGVDTKHEDLKDVLWTNPKEIPGNGIDDDKNGFIDDINGWDFLGNAKGVDISVETMELTRIFAPLQKQFEGKSEADISPNDREAYKKYQKLRLAFDNKVGDGKNYLAQLRGLQTMHVNAENILKAHFKKDEILPADLDLITVDDSAELRKAKSAMKQSFRMGITTIEINEVVDHYSKEIEFQLNPNFNTRQEIIGDNPENTDDKAYGNAEVRGPDAEHGTHVAGIIAANRSNTLGMKGVANNVKILVVRAVPDGDERDKDVANAIRYAVDNGASVINMSFGKAYSPQKQAVDEAVRYAEKKGVLLIHAAGNDSQNIDTTENYPTQKYLLKGMASNWIEVGASSYEENKVANFTNYGKNTVHVFAPGVDIYSSIPDSKYKDNSGTSMAAPVVAGLAALLKSYFPKLTALQIKKIIMDSSVKLNANVNMPGADQEIPFKELSMSGGVVNAYEAVKMALATEKK